MKNPAFTAQEIINVYLSRWLARKVANEFIGYLRPNALLGQLAMARPEMLSMSRAGMPMRIARAPTP